MYLLMRRISAYSGPDLLLGGFCTPEEAEAAKARYAQVRDAAPDADPWRHQAYKEPGPVGPDLEIETLPGEFPNGTTVYVVSDNHEGFGQDRRTLDSVHATAAAAKSRKKELDGAPKIFLQFATVDPVIVGKLHSDAPDDQPHLLRTIGSVRAFFETDTVV